MIRTFAVYILVAVGLLVPAAKVRAADDSKIPLLTQLEASKKEVADAEKLVEKALKEVPEGAEPDAKARELADTYRAAVSKGLNIATAMIDADPKSADSFEALTWALTINPKFVVVVELLAKHHAANPKIATSAAIAAYSNRTPKAPDFDRTTELLQAILKDNKDPLARAQAVYGLALQAKFQYDETERYSPSSAQLDRLGKDAETAYERVLKEFGDHPFLAGGPELGGKSLKEMSEPALFELQKLRVGQPAPEIEAADLDGKPMKLSDYKGKAVLLVFWAAWCPACVQDMPHEVELAKKFEGRPFAIVGVNGDDNAAVAKRTGEKLKTTWRSFWNGDEGQTGPITDKWNVTGWPTTYVIDAAGIIRARQVRGAELDPIFEKLVAEIEAKK